jgi:branched-chain amino acid transport system substrate-binding protein
MHDESHPKTIDRRELLKRAGAAAAAASIPLQGAAGAWAGIKRGNLNPLKIGNLTTLSGPSAALPIDVYRGFVTYVKSRGGRLGGRKIEFVSADDQQNPAVAIQQAQRLVNEEHVDLIEGIFFTNVLLGVRDTLDSLKIPTVVANAAANAITRDRRSPYIFRTSYTNYMLGAALAAWAAAHLPKPIVTTAANYGAGQESSSSFRAFYTHNSGQLDGDTIFSQFPSQADYQPIISQIQGRKPGAVWCFPAGGTESIKFVKAYRQFGLGNVPLIGNNNLTDPQSIVDALGSDGVGIRTSATWTPQVANAENKRFVAAFQKFFGGSPSAFAELGYKAAQFLDLALRKVHGDTSNKDRLAQAMAGVGSFVAPGGRNKMDPATHQLIVPFYLQQIVKRGSGYAESQVKFLGYFKDPGK